MTAIGLERRYRRLLLAYPRAYRRRQGVEILTTLMEAAGADRDRPTRREVRDLLTGGLRQRFRLPVGRMMVAVAVLSAVVAGALGAAVGSALGWAAAPGIPGDPALGAVAEAAVGGPVRHDVQPQRQAFGLRPHAIVGMAVPADWTAGAARTRLAAAGWEVGPLRTDVYSTDYDDGTSLPTDIISFVAVKDGTELRVNASMERRYGTNGMFEVRAVAPWWVLPLTVAGLLVGLAAGWLLAARVGYRVRRQSPWLQMPPVIAATVALAALGMCALQTYAGMWQWARGVERFRDFDTYSAYAIDLPGAVFPITGLGALTVLLVLAYTVTSKERNPNTTATT